MSSGEDRLRQGIVTLFKQACREGRPEVTEHLLRALESINAHHPTWAEIGCVSVLGEVYRAIAESLDRPSDRNISPDR